MSEADLMLVLNKILGIQKLFQDNNCPKVAKNKQQKSNIGQIHLSSFSIKEYFDEEVERFESKLVKILDKNAKILNDTGYFKQRQNKNVVGLEKLGLKTKED